MSHAASQIGFIADCVDCGWHTEDYQHGNRLASEHARQKGHLVRGEKTLYVEYDGRLQISPEDLAHLQRRRRR